MINELKDWLEEEINKTVNANIEYERTMHPTNFINKTKIKTLEEVVNKISELENKMLDDMYKKEVENDKTSDL